MQAILALEDGRLFRGKAFGALVERVGEVVFNTSLTGYQEIFTDPSYAGQIVVLTNPHIGNYGTSPSDAESARPYIEGLVVREFSPVSSSWRSTEVADDYLERNGVPVIAEIDTRAVVRHLRANGVMRWWQRRGRTRRWMGLTLPVSCRRRRAIRGIRASRGTVRATSCFRLL
jgi:carbamoyl-phosphate synthase small subunit